MMMYNIFALISYAFRCGCSFFGGRPYQSALKGYRGELVFMFKKHRFGNEFFAWVRSNFDSDDYQEKILFWKGKEYYSIFLLTPYVVHSKFLFAFKQFAKHGLNKVMLFNQ